MGHNYLSRGAASVATPPQSQPLDETQVKNNAGGYVYQIDMWQRLDRFLILGSEGGTYYVGEHTLTVKNIENVKKCVSADGIRTVNRIIEISDAGRAPKNDPALLALAYAAAKGDNPTRAHALANLSKVARIGTHLFHFIQYSKQFRGMGRGLRNSIVEWYASKTPEQFAQQVTKYQQRDGWSHRDLLRLTHPKFDGQHQTIAKWVVKGELANPGYNIPEALLNHVLVQKITDPKTAAKFIRTHGVVRESVPTELLNSPEVWEALLEKMPMTAMIRNLGNMSKVGLLVPMSDAAKEVSKRLQNPEALKKARIHPLGVLIASSVYGAGRGLKGSGNWTVDPKVFEALNEAFYLTFKNIEPTGKRFYLGVDVSGSMSSSTIAGTFLSARAASSAMALVTARTEQDYYIAGFQHSLVKLPFTSKTTLDSAIKHTDGLPFGSTDCAQPMLDALKNKIKADTFIVYTDSETWSGAVHPKQALEMYRQKTGINAKLVVVGMTATEFSIADPSDLRQLDVVGFDANTPAVIADFCK